MSVQQNKGNNKKHNNFRVPSKNAKTKAAKSPQIALKPDSKQFNLGESKTRKVKMSTFSKKCL